MVPQVSCALIFRLLNLLLLLLLVSNYSDVTLVSVLGLIIE